MKKTPLNTIHHDMGAKMCPFAGYEMPLYYQDGVIKEHQHVRADGASGLFDVSHMGQAFLSGADARALLEKLTPSAFAKTGAHVAKYTVLLTETGGIRDDLIVTKLADDRFFLVVNAARKEGDFEWINRHVQGMDAVLDIVEGRALLALQGASAQAALKAVTGYDAADLGYMRMDFASWDGAELFISRLGYTGEDGFEISVPADKAVHLWSGLLACAHNVKPVGLAARDSLRLEMGYPLYGHDLDETTSPVEAGVEWIIGREQAGFLGFDRIAAEREGALTRKRVGIVVTGRGVAREGINVLNPADGSVLAPLTSGGFSPTLQKSVGMAYLPLNFAVDGTALAVDIRGNAVEAVVTPLPFVQARTKTAKKPQTIQKTA